MCMPQIEIESQTRALEGLLELGQGLGSRGADSSLYIRPTMIAIEPHLGVRLSKEYLYYIVTGPVAAYYAEGSTRSGFMFPTSTSGRSGRGRRGENDGKLRIEPFCL